MADKRKKAASAAKIAKDKLACNKAKKTPSHPTKSHVVKACKDGKEKIIRFGQQGVKGAGKNPKTAKEAQFSMQFSIAMIIKFGSIKLNFLDDQYISDEDTKKLMEIIDMRVGELPNNIKKSEIICPEWSNVKLVDKSGNCYEKFVGAPIGSAKSH